MFYSHQLLARKAPLGQIWMAATMHAKMNRKKLNKINIISICEEILNPSVPMALRLSGILMGGVVIVYERKVKLLYDDVNRLMIELNDAWKTRDAPDPTVLPKGKAQAKKEAVTLPENPEIDVGNVEQFLNFSSAAASMGFQQPPYFAMRLDNVEEPYINCNLGDEDGFRNFHQADAENITLCERFHSYQEDTTTCNHFERFDIEGDEETQLNFTSREHVEVSAPLIPSPPIQNEAQRDPPEINESHAHPEDNADQQSDERKKVRQDQHKQRHTRRKFKKQVATAMDYEQTIILGPVYQTWLHDASDTISNRRANKRVRRDLMSALKVSNLMELPPLVLLDNSLLNGNIEIYYPQPLLELWIKSTQPPHDCPSARTSIPAPPEPSSSSPPRGEHFQGPFEYAFDDLSGAVSQSRDPSIEKQRAIVVKNRIPVESFMGDVNTNVMDNGVTIDPNLVTPRTSGDEGRSIQNLESGHGILEHHLEMHPGRSNKKRPHSSSRNSSSSLEPVAEEEAWLQPQDTNFRLSRLSENGTTPDNELLMETGPTQTQHPVTDQPFDHITDSIRMQMKAHFETPGAPQTESLCTLTAGMNRKGAALLFYQTCVLASRGVLKVEQNMPYGEIYISKGAKM